MILINRTILYFLIFLTALFSTTSCSFNEFQDPTKIVDIAEEIELRLLPDLYNSTRLNWLVITKENKFCSDAILSTQIVNVPSQYELLIEGISSPENCEPFNSYVSSLEGFQPIDISLFQITFQNNLFSEISIIRNQQQYQLASSEQEYFSFTQRELRIFDKLTLWAGVNSNSEEGDSNFINLLNDLQAGYETTALATGDYGYINKTEHKQIVVNPETFIGYEDNQSFQLPDEIDYDKLMLDLRSIVTTYRSDNPEQDFFIATSAGDVF